MKQYIKVVFGLCLCSVIVFSGVSVLSQLLINYTDTYIEAKIQETESNMSVPSVIGTDMGIVALYDIEKKSETLQNVYILGNSQSILGVFEADLEETLNIEIINVSMGSATLDAYILMNNFLEVHNNAPKKGDIVILDVSYALFQNKPLSQNVTASALTYGELHTIGSDLSVEKQIASPFIAYFALGAHTVHRALEIVEASVWSGGVDALYQTPTINLDGLEHTLNLDDQSAGMLYEILSAYQAQEVKVLIEILYQSDAFSESEAGHQYNAFVDSIILTQEHAAWGVLDHRKSMNPDDFLDVNHLNNQGRAHYTQKMVSILSELIEGGP